MRKRFLSIMLTLCMVLVLAPAMAFAEGGTKTGAGVAPSVTTYATKEQLMDGTFAPNANGTANNIGKLVFGSNGETAQEWYILGHDDGVSGDNTIIFATATIGETSQFNSNKDEKMYNYSAGTGYGDSDGSITVYETHYGASDYRNNLNSMVSDSNTTYFSAAEKELLNATTVTTNDLKNNLDYTTTDRLYAPAATEKGSTATIQVGSRGQVALARKNYWENGEAGNNFFTRTAFSATGLMCADTTYGVNSYGVGSFYAARPASNLNLSSVLFASAATGGAGDAITSIMPMKLRFDGSGKAIGTVTYDPMLTYDASHKIVAQKDPDATGNVFLVVQGNDGTKDWFYSVAVEATTEIRAEEIAESIGSTNFSLANCKIWLETKDETDGLIYAMNAEPGISYSVTLDTNGGTVNGGVDSYTSGQGTALPTVVNKTGYTFKGWYNKEELTGEAVTEISSTDFGDKTFWAKWEANKYNVTLNTNGGTINQGNIEGYTYGEGATLPTDVTKSGFVFGGWYDNEALTGSPVTEITATDIEDKTFYAKWEHKHCICGGEITAGDHSTHDSVVYQAWDGSVENRSPKGITYTDGMAYVYLEENAELTDCIEISDGKTLVLCLNGKELKREDLTGGTDAQKKFIVKGGARLVICDCQGGGSIICGQSAGKGGAFYVENWSSMDLFGGKITGSSAEYGGAIALTDLSPNGDSKPSKLNIYGGEISGNTAAENGGAIYIAANCSLNIFGKPVIKDNTVGEKANNVYLTSGQKLSVGDMTSGASIGISMESRDYPVTFSGAYDNDYSEYFHADAEHVHVSYNNDGKELVLAGNEYKVTLNTNGGTINNGNIESYTYGEGATLPTDVIKTGYDFKGWYDNEELTGEAVTEITVTDSEDKTFWAKWEAKRYKVTLNTNGGTINKGNIESYTYGEGATLPTDVIQTGYAFVGWYDNEELTGEAVTKITATDSEEKTFYAKWVSNRVSSETELRNLLNSGFTSITLANNFKLSSTLNLSDKIVTLDLNGHTLTGNITLNDSSAGQKSILTLIDTSTTASGVVKGNITLTRGNYGSASHLYANGGTITGMVSMPSYVGKIYCTSSTPTVFKGYVGNYGEIHGGIFYSGINKDCIKEKTITFKSGNSTYAYEVVASGSKTVAPGAPSPDQAGYVNFTSWYYGEDEYEFGSSLGEDITLWAKFEKPITYNIAYDLDGGAVAEENKTSYTVENEDITLNNPQKDGCTFIGWSGTDLTGDNNMSVTIPKGSMGDRTYTAHFCSHDTWVEKPAKKASLTEAGYTAYKECSVCHEIEGKTDIPQIDESSIELDKTTVLYDSQAKTPAVTIRDKAGKELSKDTDYTLVYSNNIKAGTATVTITFKESYEGTVKRSFEITCDHSKAVKHEASASTCTSGGIAEYWQCPGCDQYFLSKPDKDSEPVEEGSWIVKAKGHIAGKTEVVKATTKANGVINQRCTRCNAIVLSKPIYKISSISLSTTSYTYTGGVKKPSVIVKDSTGKTLDTSCYSASYASGRKNVGSYKVTVTLKGNYNGSKVLTFMINPKGTSISNVSGAKKAFTVKWKKQSAKMATSTITGYQIRYSTSSKMTKAKLKMVKGYKYTSTKITKLSAKKKYYVQIRTYKTVGGKNYYSSWSKTKLVKTK